MLCFISKYMDLILVDTEKLLICFDGRRLFVRNLRVIFINVSSYVGDVVESILATIFENFSANQYLPRCNLSCTSVG